ncbi:MAG: hypothetical protein ABI655_06680 [Phenylobacterium sp.]
MATEDPKALAELALAFARASRSICRTITLEAKLQRERLREDRADPRPRARAVVERLEDTPPKPGSTLH